MIPPLFDPRIFDPWIFHVGYFSAADLLPMRFVARPPWPFWTNRALVNGVVAAAEALIGDAPFEFVIENVMNYIKIWADANEISYVAWVDLTLVPRAIKRATTYGVVAALYARHTRTFQGRVVPTLAPMTVTVVGDDEKTMQHWTSKMDKMLELYLSAQGADRFWVSTADEDPIFSMDDIPLYTWNPDDYTTTTR